MHQTNRMLVSMVVIFGSMWLPLDLINLLADLNLIEFQCWKFYHAAFILCHVTAMSSACYNPFLYGRFNDSFQKEFLKFSPSLRFVCGSDEQHVEEGLELKEIPASRPLNEDKTKQHSKNAFELHD
jgi:hypothetical protein